jgi:hypothetical protein
MFWLCNPSPSCFCFLLDTRQQTTCALRARSACCNDWQACSSRLHRGPGSQYKPLSLTPDPAAENTIGIMNTTRPWTDVLLLDLRRALSLPNDRLFAAVLVLSVAPLWFSPQLPAVDMAQHAAQIGAMHEIWAGNEMFTRVFEINWFTPYLLGYALLYLLSLIVPIAIASQILVSIALILTPVLTGRLLRVAGADERWKWLAIPSSFGLAFYWGFLTFMLAVPLGLYFLIASIRFSRAPSVRGGITIAIFGTFLFFCHVIALCFVSLVALGYVCSTGWRNLRTLLLKLVPFAAPLPLIFIWLLLTYQSKGRAPEYETWWSPLPERAVMLLKQIVGLDVFWTVLLVPVAGAVLLLPRLGGSRLSTRPERWMPLLIGLAAYFTLPSSWLSTGFIFDRLGVFIVPLWLMLWDPPATTPSRSVDWAAILLPIVWTLANLPRFVAFGKETEPFRHVLAQMEPGRTVAAMVVDAYSPQFDAPVYMHFPSWYQATGRGIVDFNFGEFYVQPVRYRRDAGARMNDRLAWYPFAFRWDADGGDKYDYFMIKATADVSATIFKERLGSVELVAHEGGWWLYRNVERPWPQRTAEAAKR